MGQLCNCGHKFARISHLTLLFFLYCLFLPPPPPPHTHYQSPLSVSARLINELGIRCDRSEGMFIILIEIRFILLHFLHSVKCPGIKIKRIKRVKNIFISHQLPITTRYEMSAEFKNGLENTHTHTHIYIYNHNL
jgi:hypothetical protein